jgi:hypothetical protein
MPVETKTDVGQIERAVDEEGNEVPIANARQLGNFAAGVDGSETDDTNGSTLPDQAIPHGVEVVVQAQFSNANRIKVGLTDSPTIELPPGQSVVYRVQNLSQIHIVAQSDGDGVAFTAEVSA